MTGKKERLIYLCTHGTEDAEKATLPFAMALGAQATDLDVTVVLQAGAVLLAVKGEAEHVIARGMASLKEQMDEYLGNGGRIAACSACLTARKIGREDLLPDVEVVSVSWLNGEFSSATNVVCY